MKNLFLEIPNAGLGLTKILVLVYFSSNTLAAVLGEFAVIDERRKRCYLNYSAVDLKAHSSFQLHTLRLELWIVHFW